MKKVTCSLVIAFALVALALCTPEGARLDYPNTCTPVPCGGCGNIPTGGCCLGNQYWEFGACYPTPGTGCPVSTTVNCPGFVYTGTCGSGVCSGAQTNRTCTMGSLPACSGLVFGGA